MNTLNTRQTRRNFIRTAGAATLALTTGIPAAPAPTSQRTKLGIDNFAVRDMKWKAPELLKYAASLKTDSILISDMDAFETLEDKYLQAIRQQGADLGVQIHLGTWSICPTSKAFRNKWGTAEEHLGTAIRAAKALGSPVIRVVLGNNEDRKSAGGIEARIADTVKVCRALRTKAVDAGVKIAVENHAGDMQAMELASLVEQAGRDYVGVNLDSGNAAWTMEDPLESLEVLGRYALTTSLRDSAIWESANGATVQWTAMGDGDLDLKKYFKRFAELCPGVPVHIETISGFNREIPYLKEDFWAIYPKMTAASFARFLALAKRGKPREPHRNPPGKDAALANQEYQKAEIERSIRYCKSELGLGPA